MTKILFFTLFVIWGIFSFSFAQFVQISPENPKPNDTVTIIFDAALGDLSLKGCDCDVYLTSGVIQGNLANMSEPQHMQGGQGKADSQLKMEALGGDTYRFQFVPREFYDLEADEDFLQMTFSFQNIDGSILHLNAEGLAEQYPSLAYLANQALEDASGGGWAIYGRYPLYGV